VGSHQLALWAQVLLRSSSSSRIQLVLSMAWTDRRCQGSCLDQKLSDLACHDGFSRANGNYLRWRPQWFKGLSNQIYNERNILIRFSNISNSEIVKYFKTDCFNSSAIKNRLPWMLGLFWFPRSPSLTHSGWVNTIVYIERLAYVHWSYP
jgi:hypothetical protein